MRVLSDILWAAAELREVLDIDVTPELWQVLLNHAQPNWVLPPSSSSSSALHMTASAAAAGAVVPWLPQVSSAGQPLSPFTGSGATFSGGGDGGSSAAGSGGGACDGDYGSAGVPIEAFSMVQAYGEWYVQVRL
jgi:hypothetical protein